MQIFKGFNKYNKVEKNQLKKKFSAFLRKEIRQHTSQHYSTWRSFKGYKTTNRRSLSFKDTFLFKKPIKFDLPESEKLVFPKIYKTVRNASFNLNIISTFKKLVSYIDLPIDFKLEPFKLLRYRAHFYGYNYQTNFFNYNLWLTMGLKRNISMSFSLFFNSTQPRKNYLASFNKFSWKFYAYLLKNSLRSNVKLNTQFLNLTSFYLSSNLSSRLSDVCLWNLRSKFRFNRTISLGSDDLDFSISTYHHKFDYYNYRARGQFFWISNNSYFRDISCYITSYDPPLILSPRKYLKSLWVLNRFTKYHKSWYFLGKINSDSVFNWSYYSNIINLLNTCFVNSFNNYLNLKILNNPHLKIFRYFLYFFLYNNTKKKGIKIKCFNKIKDGISYSSLIKIIYFYFINCNKNLLYNKFFHSNNVKHLILLNGKKFSKNFNKDFLHSLLIKSIPLFKNNLFCKRWKFKFGRYYFRSHGYFKFRITRWKEYFKGFQTLRSIGVKNSLNIITRHQPLRPYSAFFHFYRKRTKKITKFLGMFSYKCFNFYFINVQQNWNLNTNFLKSNILDNYNFQLYYLISYLLRMQKLLLLSLTKKKRYIVPLNKSFFRPLKIKKKFNNKIKIVNFNILQQNITKDKQFYVQNAASLDLLDSYIGCDTFSIVSSRKSFK